jgi:hypothetical protein
MITSNVTGNVTITVLNISDTPLLTFTASVQPGINRVARKISLSAGVYNVTLVSTAGTITLPGLVYRN